MLGHSLAVWVLALYVVRVTPHAVPTQPKASHEAFIKSSAAPASAPVGVSAQSSKKIHMVTDTLRDILQSVKNEEHRETEIHNEYMSWCKQEISGLAKDLVEAREELANTKVLSREQGASMDSLKQYIRSNEKDIDETKDSISQAQKLRQAENQEYNKEMLLNSQSLRQIQQAIEHISDVQQQGGFLQQGVVRKLHINKPGESNYVLGVMKGLQEKLQKSRSSMRATEEDKVKMHDSFMQTRALLLNALGDKTLEKQLLTVEIGAKEAGTRRKMSRLSEEAAKLVIAVDETTRTCQKADQEWKLRQDDRSKEKDVLQEAIRYLAEMLSEQALLLQRAREEQDQNQQEESEQEDPPTSFSAFAQAKDKLNGALQYLVKMSNNASATASEHMLDQRYDEDDVGNVMLQGPDSTDLTNNKEKAVLNHAMQYLADMSPGHSSPSSSSLHYNAQDYASSTMSALSFVQAGATATASETAAMNDFYKSVKSVYSDERSEAEWRLQHMVQDRKEEQDDDHAFHGFNGVAAAVNKLIQSHQSNQEEEKSKKEYCKKEIAGKDAEKASTNDDLAVVRAELDKNSAEVAMLTEEVKHLYGSLDRVKTRLEAAGKVRKEEKAAFATGTKDRALAIRVLTQAKSVLQEFYDNARRSLVQEKQAAALKRSPGVKRTTSMSELQKDWREFYDHAQTSLSEQSAEEAQFPEEEESPGTSRKSTTTFAAVSIIEEIVHDVHKEQKEAEEQAAEAAEIFAKLQRDSYNTMNDKQQDINDRMISKAKLGVKINSLKETQLTKANDVDAINEQLASLHEKCDELFKFYDERREDRAFEVSQLKDVKTILEGADKAVRTALIQEAQRESELEDDDSEESSSDDQGEDNQSEEQDPAGQEGES